MHGLDTFLEKHGILRLNGLVYMADYTVIFEVNIGNERGQGNGATNKK